MQILRKVCIPLTHSEIFFPGHKSVKEEYHRTVGQWCRNDPIIRISFRISSVVGCIDDKHISTIAPSENETDYCMEWKDAR